MSDMVAQLRKRRMMIDVRGTGDRFGKQQIAVPDPFCQSVADEIELLLRDRTGWVEAHARMWKAYREAAAERDALRAELAEQREIALRAAREAGAAVRERDALRAAATKAREALSTLIASGDRVVFSDALRALDEVLRCAS